MKSKFEFTLSGKDWWRPFLVFWVISIIFSGFQSRLPVWSETTVGHTGVYVFGSLGSSLAMVIFQSIFTIVFMRIMIPKVSVAGKSFSFTGNIGEYLKINIGGILLTMITLSIYAPWYAKRITAYLASNTTYDGEPAEFLGRGGKLLGYIALLVYLPTVLIGVIGGLLVGFSAFAEPEYVMESAEAIFIVPIVLYSLLVTAPLSYLIYKWIVNFKWRDLAVTWRTSFWPSLGMILGQVILTTITVGIYWPAAALRLYQYFAGRTTISRGETDIGRLGFEGSIGKGFGLIWGQTLLSLITLGLYVPWATARIGAWIAAGTFHQEVAV